MSPPGIKEMAGYWRFVSIGPRRPLQCRKPVPIIDKLSTEKPDRKSSIPPGAIKRREPDGRPFEGVERRRNPISAGGNVPFPIDAPLISESTSEVSVFHELGKALTSSLQLDQVLRTIMDKINEVLRPDTWSLLLMDVDKNELYFQIATGKGAEALKDVRIKVGQGLAGWVAQTGKAVVVPDTSQGFAVLRASGRKDENGNAVDCGGAGAFSRTVPGRNRADQLHRAGGIQRARPGAAGSAGGLRGDRD